MGEDRRPGNRATFRARYRLMVMSGERMTPSRMVHVRTVPTSFHARVIAARLGSDGIVTQLRGNVGGPYPFGEVSIWVGEGDADEAAELLLADEVEAAMCFPSEEEEWSERPVLHVWTAWRLLAAVGVVLVLLATLSTRVLF
jgi:hypothetical protein